jgi:hypothetical protein
MAKQGFKGQWVQIARVGKAVDSKGVGYDLTKGFLQKASDNYNASRELHEAPATVGHPASNAPAFGWADETRMNGDALEAKFSDTADEFEQMVRQGRFKKRSTNFYIDHPTLPSPNIRHIGFLGAAAPGVKGLRNIAFSEEGESVVFEETFNNQEKNMGLEDTDVEKVSESLFEKLKKLVKPSEGGTPASQPATTASFSEADAKTLIAEAVTEATKAITTEFTEKLAEKDEELKALRESVDAGTASGRRSEIVAFVEGIPAEKGKHFLRRAGVVEFMESLAVADAKDEAPAIAFSEGEGDKKEDHKFSRLDWFKNYVNAQKSFVQFGEKFGDLKASPEADAKMVNVDRINEMKSEMGTKAKKAGGEK